MRAPVDASRIAEFMRGLGRVARRPARVYFTGGVTAVLEGWRPSAIDVDLKLVPDDDELLRAIVDLKKQLSMNIELAAPDDFVPVPDLPPLRFSSRRRSPRSNADTSRMWTMSGRC